MIKRNMNRNTKSLFLVTILISSTLLICMGNTSAEISRDYEFTIDEDFRLTMVLRTKFEKEDAMHFREEIDQFTDPGSADGELTPPEIEAYKIFLGEEAVNEMRFVTIDNTSSVLESHKVEFEGLGNKTDSQLTFYKIISATVIYPYVDKNASSHKFMKGKTEESTTIKISLIGKLQIKEYTGINNSELSKDKKNVEGEEFPGYLVIVEFEKEKKDDDDNGGFLPGFGSTGLILAIIMISLIFYVRKLRTIKQ